MSAPRRLDEACLVLQAPGAIRCVLQVRREMLRVIWVNTSSMKLTRQHWRLDEARLVLQAPGAIRRVLQVKVTVKCNKLHVRICSQHHHDPDTSAKSRLDEARLVLYAPRAIRRVLQASQFADSRCWFRQIDHSW
jgi:hypothetical protein